mmetsp:Transcript_25728/g.41328  ORF Transcript_25728/g.41328 Transcript_25728/m.41328 type:complete len:126 (-) Transcript_25728:1312-1689(-)
MQPFETVKQPLGTTNNASPTNFNDLDKQTDQHAHAHKGTYKQTLTNKTAIILSLSLFLTHITKHNDTYSYFRLETALLSIEEWTIRCRQHGTSFGLRTFDFALKCAVGPKDIFGSTKSRNAELFS